MEKTEIEKIGDMPSNVDNWRILREVLNHLWDKTCCEKKKKK